MSDRSSTATIVTLTRCCDAPYEVVRMATVFSEWAAIRCTQCGDQPARTYNVLASSRERRPLLTLENSAHDPVDENGEPI